MDQQTATIWVDQCKREHDITKVSDDYLKNIVNFVAKGGGYAVTDDKIRRIFEEARNRRIKHIYNLEDTLWYWDTLRSSNKQALYED